MVQYSMASPKPEDMRKCPFCARMIRKTARKCPFCNQTLPSDSTQRSASSVTAVPNEKSRRIFFGGLGMIIFILAFSAVFVWLGNETGRSPGFLFPLIFIQGIFVLCILLFFLASKIRPAILDVKPSGFIERVESIRFDNYFFLLAREFVYWLDNKIFNHNGRAGYGYHPTRFSLVVPFWLSLFTCVIHFLRSLSWRGSFDDPYRIIMTCMPVLLGNLLFCCKNVLFFSDRIRQICYPIFIGICSLGFFLLIVTLKTDAKSLETIKQRNYQQDKPYQEY